MKRTISIIVLILVCVGLLYASDGIFRSFTANSNGSVITIEWRTGNENGLTKFEIERSSNSGSFFKIADESAKGFSTTYKYVDSDAFMKSNEILTGKFNDQPLSKNSYTYRLKAIYSNGNAVYSDEVNVSHTINSVRRTWGMIKELFR